MKVSCSQLREHQWKTFVRLSRFWSLKAHQQISKNSVLKSIVHVTKHTNFQLYKVHPDRVNLTIDNRFINKRVRLFTHQTMCQEEKIIFTSFTFLHHFTSRLQNSCLTTFFKKIQNQSLEVQKQSPEVFYKKDKKGIFKNFTNLTGKHLW